MHNSQFIREAKDLAAFLLSFCNTRNTASGRLYLTSELEKVIKELNDSKKEMFGQFTGSHEFSVSLEDVTHRCYNFRIKGDTAICDAEILNTPKGIILKELLLADLPFKFCIRCTGYVDKNNVVTDINLIAIDVEMSQ